jgi:hypothetical protein
MFQIANFHAFVYKMSFQVAIVIPETPKQLSGELAPRIVRNSIRL